MGQMTGFKKTRLGYASHQEGGLFLNVKSLHWRKPPETNNRMVNHQSRREPMASRPLAARVLALMSACAGGLGLLLWGAALWLFGIDYGKGVVSCCSSPVVLAAGIILGLVSLGLSFSQPRSTLTRIIACLGVLLGILTLILYLGWANDYANAICRANPTGCA